MTNEGGLYIYGESGQLIGFVAPEWSDYQVDMLTQLDNTRGLIEEFGRVDYHFQGARRTLLPRDVEWSSYEDWARTQLPEGAVTTEEIVTESASAYQAAMNEPIENISKRHVVIDRLLSVISNQRNGVPPTDPETGAPSVYMLQQFTSAELDVIAKFIASFQEYY